MNQPRELDAVLSTALLEGVNVVELSRHVAGAYCGRLLAQLGASVVRFGPDTDAVGSARTRQAMQRVLHAGKTAEPLDEARLQRALGAARLVIVEKDDHEDPFADHVAQIIEHRKWLTRDALVVVLSASGDGDGYRPGCGLTSSAWAAMSWAIGEPAREPLTPPYDIVDYEAGASAAGAALVALLADAGAACSPIDVAARDVVAHLVSTLAQNYVPYGRHWQRDGRRPFMSGGIYPLGLFTCSDGHVALYCRSTEQWRGILQAMGDPEWSHAERFSDPRVIARKHGDEADLYLLPWLARHTKSEIMALGLQHGFPAAPVRYIEEALDNPQFAFRGSLRSVVLDDGKSVVVPAEAWRLYQGPSSAIYATNAMLAAAKPWPIEKSRSPAPSAFLKGLRVLDLSWVWSGPLVTSILADLGAEVIKIEHPSRLDSVRQRGRPVHDGKEKEGPVLELNPWFNQLNHGKRSVVLDIKSLEGQAAIRKLAATCDVVVENMRPGALDKLGLGYADFVEVNPSVVMLSMSLAGRAGPLSHMKGYAGIMTSMAGLESLVGHEEPDGAQTVVGMAKTALGDPNAASHAICALMAALYRRKSTGRGVWIDLSQTDAILAILAGPLIESQLYGAARTMGNQHPLYAPHGHFRCKGEESWVAVSVQIERQWDRLLRVAGDAALSNFAGHDAPGRVNQRREIERALEAWTSRQTPAEVVAKLTAAGVPVAPVASYEAMIGAAWRQQRALSRMVDHPYIGRQEVVVPPWRFGNQSAGVERPAPLLGADTEAVLAALNERASQATSATPVELTIGVGSDLPHSVASQATSATPVELTTTHQPSFGEA